MVRGLWFECLGFDYPDYALYRYLAIGVRSKHRPAQAPCSLGYQDRSGDRGCVCMCVHIYIYMWVSQH